MTDKGMVGNFMVMTHSGVSTPGATVLRLTRPTWE